LNQPTSAEECKDSELLDEDKYLRLLDSLARFYNSEITVHVGYLISMSAFVIAALLSLFTPVFFRPDIFDCYVRIATLAVVALIGVTYFFVPLRWPPVYSFRYLYGQTLYYIVLSRIVWEHMGLNTKCPWKEDSLEHRLRKRAMQGEGGVVRAVHSLFEARLFVSRCLRAGIEHNDPRVTGNLDAFGIQDKGRQAILDLDEHTRHYDKRVFLPWWHMVDLLFLAYRGTIEDYRKRPPVSEGEKNAKRIGELLMLHFAPSSTSCPKCASTLADSRSGRYYCPNCQSSFQK